MGTSRVTIDLLSSGCMAGWLASFTSLSTSYSDGCDIVVISNDNLCDKLCRKQGDELCDIFHDPVHEANVCFMSRLTRLQFL